MGLPVKSGKRVLTMTEMVQRQLDGHAHASAREYVQRAREGQRLPFDPPSVVVPSRPAVNHPECGVLVLGQGVCCPGGRWRDALTG